MNYIKLYIVKLFILLAAFCIRYTDFASAQFSNMHFEHLTIEDGLSSNSVQCILRNSKGYLWLGTDRGLNKYDGVKIKSWIQVTNATFGFSKLV